jgi:hypothetical protein
MFVTDLVRRNFSEPLLYGTPDRRSKKERERTMERFARKPLHIRRMILDRILNEDNHASVRETLGWKHMFPPLETLSSLPKFVGSTLFLVTVKHPVFWALSYHRHPIDSAFRVKKMRFSDFIRHPFLPTLRDNVTTAFYDSVIDFYADKTRGHRELAALGSRVEIVRYESLIADVGGFLHTLARQHGLQRKSEEPSIRTVSTKHSDAQFEDYRRGYRLERIREVVSAEDYEFILRKFGEENLVWLGYTS